MNKINVTIEGVRWSKTYFSSNISITSILKNALNTTTQTIKHIIIKFV